VDAKPIGDPIPGTDEIRKLAAYSGDPWVAVNEYFQAAEASMQEIWRTLIFPFIEDCDFDAVIDLGAGHGRNSRILADQASRLLVLDIQEENVEVCRRRFAGMPHVECAVNGGYDFVPAGDEAFTLIYTFDSMVHFEKSVVRSYLRDARRVLRPGGRGSFHHSNFVGGSDWRTNPHGRNFMSSDLFASYAREEGLKVLRQRIFEWGHVADLDCLTLVERV
jgi:SAM-dependent methyltransferase